MAKKQKSRHQRRAAAMRRMGARIEELEMQNTALRFGGRATLEALRDTAEERNAMAELAAASLENLALLNEFVLAYQGVIAAYNRDWEEAQQENQLRSVAEVRNWTYGEFWATVSEAWNQHQLFHVKATQRPKIERSSWPSGSESVHRSEFTTVGEVTTHFAGIGRVVVPCTITHYVSIRPEQISCHNVVNFLINVGSKSLNFYIRSDGRLFYRDGQLLLERGDTFMLRDEEGNSAGDSSHFATVYNFLPMQPKLPSDW